MTDRATISELARRRGFFMPTANEHGGSSGFYTFGPYGENLLQNIIESWKETFVTSHGFEHVRSPTVMPSSVFEASGHIQSFDDLMLSCDSCGSFHRADHLAEDQTELEVAEDLSEQELQEHLSECEIHCPTCSSSLDDPSIENFNLMFQTDVGPHNSSDGYLRPETAQGTLSEFSTLKTQTRQRYPIGLGQVGRSYRNEISPRKSLIRTREFTQAELQTFIIDSSPPRASGNPEIKFVDSNDNKSLENIEEYDKIQDEWIEYYVSLSFEWMKSLGVEPEKIRFRQHKDEELAHYSEECWDLEVNIHEDWTEIAGIANRSSNDLEKHSKYTGSDYQTFVEYENAVEKEQTDVTFDMSLLGSRYRSDAPKIKAELEDRLTQNPELASQESVSVETDDDLYEVSSECFEVTIRESKVNGEKVYPEVTEPAFGMERVLYAVLESTHKEEIVNEETRTYFEIPPRISPRDAMVTVSVSKDELLEEAEMIVDILRKKGMSVDYEKTGSIGKRYRRADEVGTPYAVTVDHQTLEDGSVTVRDRDSMEQFRIDIDELSDTLESLNSEVDFDSYLDS